MGENIDLPDLMSDWLSWELRLSQSSSVVITKAYRIGAKVNTQREGPRDMIISLLNVRWKQRILSEPIQRNYFKFKASKVLIFPDLSKEALQKRHELKSIMQFLMSNNVTCRWVTPLKISVRHQGKPFLVGDEKSGRQMLHVLKLDMNMDEEMTEDKNPVKRNSILLNPR